jgi:dTDP-4-amino-4,6-dideoxygalactose transaminase
MSRIYLSSPDVGSEEESRVLEAIRSGWVAPLGPEVDGFERDMAARIGVDHAVALSSGTAALHLGLLGLGVRAGDIVVTSTMTFAATANAITYTGAVPFFVDSDEPSGNMRPDLLDDALTMLASEGARVGAVVPVDLLGRVADYSALLPIAERHGVPVLSDAAESMGALHRGRPAGCFGHASVFSFNGNKIMTTSGGGMLLTDDGDLARYVSYLSTQARQPARHYEHTEVGYNYRLSNLLAAVGRAQLSRLDGMMARRAEHRDAYRQIFADTPGVTIFQGTDDAEDNHWLTAILVDSEEAGWHPLDLADHLAAADIESRPLWKPMHLQPAFAGYRSIGGEVSESLFRRGLTLPSGSGLSDDSMAFVRDTIRGFLGPPS